MRVINHMQTPLRIARFRVEVVIPTEENCAHLITMFEHASHRKVIPQPYSFYAYFDSATEAAATISRATETVGGCKTRLEEGSYYCLVLDPSGHV